MCEDIVKIVNGHFFKSVGGVIGGFFKQRKVQMTLAFQTESNLVYKIIPIIL